jgi:hypothetical protein
MYIGSRPGTEMSPTDLGMSIMRGVGDPTSPAMATTTLPADAVPYAEGKSQLSPQEMAQVQAQNRFLQAQAASKQAQFEKTIAIVGGAALVLVLGIVLYKTVSDGHE